MAQGRDAFGEHAGRPLRAKPAKIVRLKVHRTVSLDARLDEHVYAYVQAHDETYSGFVESAIRRALDDLATAIQRSSSARM